MWFLVETSKQFRAGKVAPSCLISYFSALVDLAEHRICFTLSTPEANQELCNNLLEGKTDLHVINICIGKYE